LGVHRALSTREAGTGSNHTGCQIPVVRSYQMMWGRGRQSCLPRGCVMSVGMSSARTVTTCSASGRSAAVMSAENGVWPPSWAATWIPLTHTVAR
jgi:hypothetical protein